MSQKSTQEERVSVIDEGNGKIDIRHEAIWTRRDRVYVVCTIRDKKYDLENYGEYVQVSIEPTASIDDIYAVIYYDAPEAPIADIIVKVKGHIKITKDHASNVVYVKVS